MPIIQAPGVFIEEVSFREKTIEGVDTRTAGFIGPTHTGPLSGTPSVLHSLAEFAAIYGDGSPMDFGGPASTNHMWHAARAFFEEGGQALYVSRVFRPKVDAGQGGADGQRPEASDYAGRDEPLGQAPSGLKQFEALPDIAMVAAPGCTAAYATHQASADAIITLLIDHAQRMKHRIALIDAGEGQSVSEVQQMRSRFDASHGAMYFPWVVSRDPLTGEPVTLPPSGFVAGLMARVDTERGVWKAPANEVVRTALDFETRITKAQQDVLNPLGINCFRDFEGRGKRLWGARTMSSDPEWKYVSVRRYLCYLERSVSEGTQWACFEPNGDALWARLEGAIRDFLLREWQAGALLGDRPEKALFVRCDRSTMSQNDLDHGRLVCQIGVAVSKPAEFRVFRIGQWTADRQA
jgi:uncharacterized protein